MHPENCPEWEYSNHPNREEILKREAAIVLIQMRQKNFDLVSNSSDSRLVHRHLFRQLTPPEHDYFAGHYRGEDFPCLEHYEVVVPNDPHIGLHSSLVLETMDRMGDLIFLGIKALDTAHQLPPDKLSPVDNLLNTVAFACRVFVEVLRVHPYANGNGHAARFIVLAILGRYGYWLKQFPLEPRPSAPDYTECIKHYTNGDPKPLEEYILKCIAG